MDNLVDQDTQSQSENTTEAREKTEATRKVFIKPMAAR